MEKRNSPDKEYTEGIDVGASRATRWFDNFWYHYKWVTVIVCFFLIVGIICSVQMCTKEKSDIVLVYAGRNQLSVTEVDDLCKAFEAVCPPEIAKKGEANVGLSTYYILSEEQIKDIEAQTHEDGERVYVDRNYVSNQYKTYLNYISTGESSVLLVDRWLYESLVASERLAPLSDIFGKTPEDAFGEYGVELRDTVMYNEYKVMQKLPEDTVLCILRPYVVGKSSKEKYYALEKKMLESILYKRIDW